MLKKIGEPALTPDRQRVLEAIGEKLLANGYEDVETIDDGIDGWKAAGRPTEPETQEQPVPTVDEAGIQDW